MPMTFRLEQPFLQGKGTAVNRAQIYISLARADQSLRHFKDAVLNLIEALDLLEENRFTD